MRCILETLIDDANEFVVSKWQNYVNRVGVIQGFVRTRPCSADILLKFRSILVTFSISATVASVPNNVPVFTASRMKH